MPTPLWKPGQSGNPNGRPRKAFALTGLLEVKGRKAIDVDGKKVSGNRFVAERVWELLTAGKTELLEHKRIEVNGQGWFEMLEWYMKQTEPAPQRFEHSGPDGGPLEHKVIEIVEHGEAAPLSPAD